jgi:hypothetical protein
MTEPTAIENVRNWELDELDPAYHAACIRDCVSRALEHEAALKCCPVDPDGPVQDLGPVLRTALSLCNRIAPEEGYE